MYELHQHEQYFFDETTITQLTTFLSQFENICALCAPMVGKALNNAKKDITILDIDNRFTTEKGYLNWNIYKPGWINQTFDIIFCDPPFFNVSLSQLFKAIRMLSHNNFEQKLMLCYLSRRSEAIISSFHLFNIKSSGYYPSYITIQKIEKNQVEIFSNIQCKHQLLASK